MTGFPDTLRKWRKARRFSQLDLALEAEVSSRHISFLETGRARPSPQMVGRLGDALNLPLEVRNALLTQAGFAARFPGRDWSGADMAPVRAALDHMMTGHAPYPAFAVDRLWQVQRMNAAATRLFGAAGIATGDSLLAKITDGSLRGVIENWPEVACHAARRLRLESAAQGGSADLDHAADLLAQEPQPDTPTPAPVIPTVYRLGDLRLALISTIAQFGTPEDLTLDDLKIEMFFPADAETASLLRGMAGA